MQERKGFTDKVISSKSDAVEKGRKGGIASGKARRKKKELQELARALLETSRHTIP